MDVLSSHQFQHTTVLALRISVVIALGFLTSGCAPQSSTPNPDAFPTQPTVSEVLPTQIIPTETAPLPTAEFTATAEPTLAPTATETAAPEIISNFPERYNPVFTEHYEAEIYGLTIPIDLGLTGPVVNRERIRLMACIYVLIT